MHGEILIVVFFIFIIFMSVLSMQERQSILQQWARQHGYDLLEANYCYFFRGPFFLNSTKSQTVYRIKISNHETGEVRSGWARVGHWFWGTLGGQDIKVIWDKEPEPYLAKPKNKLKRKNEELIY